MSRFKKSARGAMFDYVSMQPMLVVLKQIIMAFKKTKSSHAQRRKKSKTRLKIDASKNASADQLIKCAVNTLFDLNYELHHATILDDDDLAAIDAKKRINKSIEMFAFMSTKITSKDPITYQESVDKMKFINEGIYQQTKSIVQQYGRNHTSN